MPKNTVMENFNWLVPEFTIEKSTPRSVILKVKGGKGGSISKNRRKYLDEEFSKGARTATGKYVDVNHNKQKTGKIHLGEYEDGELEFLCEVWKEPYATLLRTKSPSIKGWSISANYLYNECSKCGKRFVTEQEYLKHMTEVEFVRDGVTVPRGLVFDEYALSIVTEPEVPGLTTSYTVMETVGKGLSQLQETVIKQKIIEEEYKMKETDKIKATVAVTPRPEIAIGSVAEIKTKEQVTTQTTEKPKNQEQKAIESTKTELESINEEIAKIELELAKLEDWDKKELLRAQLNSLYTRKNALITLTTHQPTLEKLTLTEPCSAELKACVDKLIADGKSEDSAWAICRSQLGETITLHESTLGSVTYTPIEYARFEDALKETKDELQAARTIKQNREVNEAFKMLVDSLNEVIADINKPLKVTFPYVDESWKTHLTTLTNSYNKLAETINSLPKDDLGWKAIKPYDDAEVKKDLSELKEANTALQESLRVLTSQVAEYKQKIDEKDRLIEKVAGERNQKIEQIVKQNEELTNKAKETVEEKRRLEEAIGARLDNVEHYMKGEFKGKHGKIEDSKNEPILTDPLKAEAKK